jgi:hypothetical protein
MSAVLHIYNSHPLKKFLEECRTVDKRKYTMSGLSSEFTGKWLIPDDKYERFGRAYHDYLFVKNARPAA